MSTPRDEVDPTASAAQPELKVTCPVCADVVDVHVDREYPPFFQCDPCQLAWDETGKPQPWAPQLWRGL